MQVLDENNIEFILRVIEKSAPVSASKSFQMLKKISSDISHFLISKTYRTY